MVSLFSTTKCMLGTSSSGRPFLPRLGGSQANRRGPVARHSAVTGGGGGGSIGANRPLGGDGDDDSKPSGSDRTGILKGWDERVAADPEFAYKVFVEQVIGVGASVVGDMASRPNWGLNELDFVFATLVVGSIVNFALMYLLAATGPASQSVGNMSLLQRMFSETTLKAWGAPGGHLFEPGFSIGQRAINFAYKGFVFAFVGMCAGLAGTTISNGLLLLRQRLDPAFEPANKPPNILYNAATWSLHMGVSSNLRYQMLNGMDMVLQPMMPAPLFKVFTSIIRAGNNMLGGISFVMLAKLFGVQQATAPVEAVAPPAATGAKQKKKQ